MEKDEFLLESSSRDLSDSKNLETQDERQKRRALISGLRAVQEGKAHIVYHDRQVIDIPVQVTSHAISKECYISSLLTLGYEVTHYAQELLRSDAFVISSGKVLRLIIVKGETLESANRVTSKMREVGLQRGYNTPPAEAGPLLRAKLSNTDIKQMGLSGLIVMHEPLPRKGFKENFFYLPIRTRNADQPILDTAMHIPQWKSSLGFVFLVSS